MQFYYDFKKFVIGASALMHAFAVILEEKKCELQLHIQTETKLIKTLH